MNPRLIQRALRIRRGLVGACLALSPFGVLAETNKAPDPLLPDNTADIVIGQPDFTRPFANRTDGRGLIAPAAVAVDTGATPHRLYVADPGNHRVLGYRLPLPTTRPARADLVIGQADMGGAYFNDMEAGRDRLLTPVGLAVDPQGNLYVSDRDYNRVVEFDRPFETDALADRVFGQAGSFKTLDPNNGGLSADSLDHPGGIVFDPHTQTLWIADTGNHRVLGYRSPRTTDTTADVVVGQPDFRTGGANAGGRSSKSLCGPLGVSALAGMLAVADTANHRVLIYRSPATASTADTVLGQDGSFTSARAGCSPFRLRGPAAVTLIPPPLRNTSSQPVDLPTRLLIGDTANNRVLLLDLSARTSGQPIALWGQSTNLHTGEPNPG
ncbi:MAG TPA: NHL repeat-containing protein, partial [Phycisphaerae bacterium]|nr:NHL repeat-containing protein [Phycisphaerae bacterium]